MALLCYVAAWHVEAEHELHSLQSSAAEHVQPAR